MEQLTAVVRTSHGDVRGSVVAGVNTFKGLPFAAPPFGPNRFRPPRPVEPWPGVRDALAYGPTPITVGLPPAYQVVSPVIPGEDCLNLNVWTPELGPAGLPVMVWIPGGAFEAGAGSSPWYDGSRFARDGIVCVTINYRVGADGFLQLGGPEANLGLLDQVAALQWVQLNVAHFGGDPDNVTIFGESAGGMSVGTLLSMPCAEGLFRRAMAQSGAAHQVISADAARRVSRLFTQRLGVAPTPEAVAAVPSDRLLRAQLDLKAELMTDPDPERWGHDVVVSMMPWQPAVDGTVLPAPPIDRIVAGASAGVDLVVGTTTDEWRLFLVLGGVIDGVTLEALTAAVTGYGLPVEAALVHYRAAHPDAGPGDLLAAVQTDWYCRVPALRLADAHADRPGATYMYEFDWHSPQYGGALGACHGLELPFVFDTLGNETALLCGDQPPQQLADAMHAAWVGFARTGACGWPRYDLGRRATMRFGTTSEVVDDPRAAERRLWAGVR